MVNIVATVCLLKTSDKQQFFKTLDKIEELLHPYTKEPYILRTLLTWFIHYLRTHGMITTIPAIEERLNIAKKMLMNTMDDAIILTITTISPDELQTMKKKIGSDYTIRRKS